MKKKNVIMVKFACVVLGLMFIYEYDLYKFQHKGRATRSRHVHGTTHGEPVIVGTPIVAAVMCRVDIVDVVLVITQEQRITRANPFAA